MSEQPDKQPNAPPAVFAHDVEGTEPPGAGTGEFAQPLLPGQEEIPVEELIRVARELTQRITNDDRQRLARELKESGHQASIRTKAPVEILEFFSGEVDLDNELVKRFAHAPLLSQVVFRPEKPSAQSKHRASAMLTTQDDAAMLTVDLSLPGGEIEVAFTLGGMLSQRFHLGLLEATDRHRWLDLMRRESGIAFLWTRQRWEQDYMIFIVRENFARVYAFSPRRIEAAVRITPDTLAKLLDWLELFWASTKAAGTPDPTSSPTKPVKAVPPTATHEVGDKRASQPSPTPNALSQPHAEPPPTSPSPEDGAEDFPFEW